ncbi:hypothetical protein [Chryseobacterium populi]|uniref:Uncharacterized protein n=1 Tax=Chryseobacterium populi TaxID=1144316 RepID=J3CCH7_9FLAO|nr:hypothetical protein [Chryseobacterium populi]EJL68691.1 hypothetical protein PMI13_03517 [Chryseobacterium populi]
MALDNLISLNLAAADLTKLDQAILAIETVLVGKTINLTPEERQQYGSIAEQNKLFVNKVKNLMDQFPQYVPNFLDKAEFARDFVAREQVEQRLNKLSSLTEQLSDTKVLLDHDNYQNAITFYRNLKYLSGENVPGTNVIYEDMRQFFVTITPTATPQDPPKDTP